MARTAHGCEACLAGRGRSGYPRELKRSLGRGSCPRGECLRNCRALTPHEAPPAARNPSRRSEQHRAEPLESEEPGQREHFLPMRRLDADTLRS
ncbi:hypothetical protein M2253_000331 [Leucobacter luti]|nr:hypothetical protein [Leucobacter luti]